MQAASLSETGSSHYPRRFARISGRTFSRFSGDGPSGSPLSTPSAVVEVRTSFGGDIYRVLFCLDRSTMVLLHGFKKKSQRTPISDLDLARKRQRKLEEDG